MTYSTHNNHFQFGWGEGLFNFDDQRVNYWMKFGRCEYLPTSFKFECIRAARLISENAKKPVLVCFSGGIDSEVVVRSFQEANVDFEVGIMNLIYRGNTSLNQHDIKYAKDYVEQHKLKHIIIDIDFDEFLQTHLLSNAKKYKSELVGILLHREMIKSFPDHHCVLGGGDIQLQRHRFNDRPELTGLYLEEEEISISLMESAREIGNDVSNRFFMHTPEIMLAWIMDPDIQHWIKYEYALASPWTNMNYFGIKPYTLYRHWPDMAIRPKYTGLEKFYDLYHNNQLDNDTRKIVDDVKKYGETEIIIDLKDLIEQLMPK
jgi:Asparagine synthase